MKNRIFFFFSYKFILVFRLIGAKDGNHGWLKIGRIKKGVKWNVLVLYTDKNILEKKKSLRGIEIGPIFQRWRERIDEWNEWREKDYLGRFFDSSNINSTRSTCRTCFAVKQKKKKFSSGLILEIIMGWETMKLSGLL